MLSAHLSTRPFIIPPTVYQYTIYRSPSFTCVKVEAVCCSGLGLSGSVFMVPCARARWAFVYEGRRRKSRGVDERETERDTPRRNGKEWSCRSCERYRNDLRITDRPRFIWDRPRGWISIHCNGPQLYNLRSGDLKNDINYSQDPMMLLVVTCVYFNTDTQIVFLHLQLHTSHIDRVSKTAREGIT